MKVHRLLTNLVLLLVALALLLHWAYPPERYGLTVLPRREDSIFQQALLLDKATGTVLMFFADAELFLRLSGAGVQDFTADGKTWGWQWLGPAEEPLVFEADRQEKTQLFRLEAGEVLNR